MSDKRNPEYEDAMNAEELDLNLSLPSMPGIKVNKKEKSNKLDVFQGDLDLETALPPQEAPEQAAPPTEASPQDLSENQSPKPREAPRKSPRKDQDGPGAKPTAAYHADDLSKAHCPSCKSEVNPDATICLNCGFNFMTGEKNKLRTDDGTMPEMRMKEILASKKAEKLAQQVTPATETHIKPDPIERDAKGRPLSAAAKQVAEEHRREALIVPRNVSIAGTILCIISVALLQNDVSMQLSWRTADTFGSLLLSHLAVFTTWMLCGFIGLLAMVIIYGYSFELKTALLRLYAVLSVTYAAGNFGLVLFSLMSGGTMAFIGLNFSIGLEIFFSLFMGMWIFKFNDSAEIRTFFLTSRILPYVLLFLGLIPFTDRDIDEAALRAFHSAQENFTSDKAEYIRLLPPLKKGQSRTKLTQGGAKFMMLLDQDFDLYFWSSVSWEDDWDTITSMQELEFKAMVRWSTGSVHSKSEGDFGRSKTFIESSNFEEAKEAMWDALHIYNAPLLVYLNENLNGASYEIEGDPSPFTSSYVIMSNWDDFEGEDDELPLEVATNICLELSRHHDRIITPAFSETDGLEIFNATNLENTARKIDAESFKRLTTIDHSYLTELQPVDWRLVRQKLRFDLRDNQLSLRDSTNYTFTVMLPINKKTLLTEDFQFKVNQIHEILKGLGFHAKPKTMEHVTFHVD